MSFRICDNIVSVDLFVFVFLPSLVYLFYPSLFVNSFFLVFKGWRAKGREPASERRSPRLRKIQTSRRGLLVLSSFSCMSFYFPFFQNYKTKIIFYVFFRADSRVLNLNLFVTKLREEFRKQFKEAHPNNKSVATVSDFIILMRILSDIYLYYFSPNQFLM